MQSHILRVSTLNAYIQQVLAADDILADSWVEGEISRITQARSGHLYFTLSESDSNIDCIMWRSHVARQAFVPKVGDGVIIHGRTDFYPPQGRLQVVADVIEHQGQGILALEMERLRQKLDSEGLFDPSRKRPLPAFPQRIGVVTSSSGAVWHDIQTVAARRFPLVELVLIPASVQGADAPKQIVAAIQQLCELESIDVMIVGRGGGSAEDLSCFNDEQVARAIFASTVPVVSAVGHETDVSIADMVADVRAATPSAATEMILPDVHELLQVLNSSRDNLMRCMERHLAHERDRLNHCQRRLHQQSPVQRIAHTEQHLALLARRMTQATQMDLRQRASALDARNNLLAALNPRAVLKRGFACIEDLHAASPVRRVAQLHGATPVKVSFHDGSASGSISPDTNQQLTEGSKSS